MNDTSPPPAFVTGFSIAFLILLSFGCAKNDESEPAKASSQKPKHDQTRTVQQPLVNGSLGEAVDMSKASGKRLLGRSCVGVKNYNLTNLGNWNVKAFYTYSMKSANKKIDLAVNGDVNLKNTNITADLEYFHKEASTQTDEVFTAVAKVETIRRSFDPGVGEGKYDDLCENVSFSGYNSFDSFRNDCGTGYIYSETLGGYVVLTATLSSLSSEKKRELESKVDLSAGNLEGGLSAMASAVNSMENVSLEFRVEIVGGLPSPDQSSYVRKNGSKYMEPAKLDDGSDPRNYQRVVG